MEKDLEDFAVSKSYRDGRTNQCRLCQRAARRAWFASKDEDYRQGQAAKNRITYLARHGMTLATFDAMLVAQDNRCGSCGSSEWGGYGRPSIDHDHQCCPGKFSCGSCVRGLLCTGCNVFAGFMESERKGQVEAYLARWA